jgi:magnesium transporter
LTAFHSDNIEEVRLRLEELVKVQDLEGIQALLQELHPSDVADLVEALDSEEERVAILQGLSVELASETLAEMDEEEDPGELLAALDPKKGAELIHELEVDDAVDLVGDLEPEKRAKILAALPLEEAGEIRGLLRYDEESAGGLMNPDLVRVESSITAGQAIAEVRRQGPGTGYDALRRQNVNMAEVGILDAAGVLRLALMTAVSGAAMALSTETIVHKRRPQTSLEP